MIVPPPITREARDWLRDCLVRMGGSSEGDTAYQTGVRHTTEALRQKLYSMPTSSADPLDAVRARFQPKTRGSYEYEIFAERDGCLWGRYLSSGNGWTSTGWSSIDGKYLHDFESLKDLLPVSPYAALIAELRREATQRKADLGKCRMADLMQQAADALEKQP